MAGPFLPNLEPLLAAGINPKTGLPIKFGGDPKHLKEDVKKFLRLIDEQDACNRYVWYNLPTNITSQELERLLYYRGQLALVYLKELDDFLILPYALNGTIDVYGRYNTIRVVPISAGTKEEEKNDPVATLLAKHTFKCVYGVKLEEELQEDDLLNSAVLLHDYTKQLSQTIIPRSTVNDPLLDVMAECVPMARTSRLLASGVMGVRVNDEDQSGNVMDANRAIEDAAMTGKAYVPIVGSVEFQELQNGVAQKGEEYMLAMQSLDNLRLSGYGIDNGGLFEKKAHELQSEADINGGPVGLVLQDGLSIRQNFCNIVNSIWGLGIWCEPAQNIMGVDIDGDGLTFDENDSGENGGIEMSNEGGEDNE